MQGLPPNGIIGDSEDFLVPFIDADEAARGIALQVALERAIPFRRLARPEEIAAAILFFVSPRSDFVTGQVLSVSGGLTMAG